MISIGMCGNMHTVGSAAKAASRDAGSMLKLGITCLLLMHLMSWG
jgi:hypothetical protein